MHRSPPIPRLAARLFAVGALWTALAAAPLPAQESAGAPSPTGSGVQWWQAAAAVAGVGLLTAFDAPIQRFFQSHRGNTSDGIASVVRHMGQPEAYATAGLGILAAGLISGDRGITNAGIRVSSAMALTGALVWGTKYGFGRARPSESGMDADDFFPFSGRGSVPSGHTAMSFALATALSDEIHNPWATAALYTFAAGTALSRVNDNAHWFSDVVAGSMLGIVSSKFATGRLAVFGIRAPAFIPRQGGVSVGWSGQF